MPRYSIAFRNETDRVFTMGVYQTLSGAVHVDSVSWLQVTVAPGAERAVEWFPPYDVVLGRYDQQGNRAIYEPVQLLPAEPGTAWEVVFENGVQQLRPAGQARGGRIALTNRSERAADVGIGQSNHASVYRRSLNSGATTDFAVSSASIYVGLFTNLSAGEIIANNVVAGPEAVSFGRTETQATLTASVRNQSIVLQLVYR
jgi:hypothetical protein